MRESPTNLTPGIRNAVRAIILKKDQILLLEKTGNGQGPRYALPGGAQDLGETLEDALIRECIEEIGTSVRIQRLLYIADRFKQRLTTPSSTRHLVEFLFLCTIPDTYVPQNGLHPDKRQTGVLWMDQCRLHELDFAPGAFADVLSKPMERRNAAATYLGRVV